MHCRVWFCVGCRRGGDCATANFGSKVSLVIVKPQVLQCDFELRANIATRFFERHSFTAHSSISRGREAFHCTGAYWTCIVRCCDGIQFFRKTCRSDRRANTPCRVECSVAGYKATPAVDLHRVTPCFFAVSLPEPGTNTCIKPYAFADDFEQRTENRFLTNQTGNLIRIEIPRARLFARLMSQ